MPTVLNFLSLNSGVAMRTKLLIAVFLAGGMLAVVQAQQGRGGGMFGIGGGPAALIVNKAVKEDLKVSEDQGTKITDWAKDFKDKANEIRKDKGVERGGFGKGGNKGGAPSTEMMEKMAAANAEISKLAYKELGEILNKDQIKRLKEIDRQQKGLAAFTEADVADALKLTDDQNTKIKGYATDMGKERREIMSDAGLGGGGGGFKKGDFDVEKFKEATTKIQKAEKEYMVKAVDQLNDEQKKTFKTLIGEPFDLTKLTQPMRKKD